MVSKRVTSVQSVTFCSRVEGFSNGTSRLLEQGQIPRAEAGTATADVREDTWSLKCSDSPCPAVCQSWIWWRTALITQPHNLAKAENSVQPLQPWILCLLFMFIFSILCSVFLKWRRCTQSCKHHFCFEKHIAISLSGWPTHFQSESTAEAIVTQMKWNICIFQG